MPQRTSSRNRSHIVLIPGFAGFDALGQLEYYAGVTQAFRHWLKQHPGTPAVLHYFDNFPTAAVATRAKRLERYLAKRIARGTFLPGDRLALVGHSTGGLDIRRLVWTLGSHPRRPIRVDGGEGSAIPVSAGDILELVHRMVFLSVPQWGTNIADWVRAHAIGRKAVVAALRAMVEGSQFPVLDKSESWLAEGASRLMGLDLLRAVQDALAEADARTCQGNPICTADALEAAAEIELWLRLIDWDFSAIDDLTAAPPPDDEASPAHFTSSTRDKEIHLWNSQRPQIRTRSYATLGRRPFVFAAGKPAPVWSLLEPWTYPSSTSADPAAAATDLAYRTCYRACAGGPFDVSSAVLLPKFLNAAQQKQIDLLTNGGRLELWDNDGIVNTGSMFWPNGVHTVLVPGDHLDIVGHYKPVKVASVPDGGHAATSGRASRGRQHHAYDLLASDSGFDDESFEQVWRDVFDFAFS